MTDDATANYLRDLGDLVKRSALNARDQLDSSPTEAGRTFETGRLTAYYEMVSLMQQQAIAFGIELTQVALDDIDPDRDLL
jgi:hypothetical protein